MAEGTIQNHGQQLVNKYWQLSDDMLQLGKHTAASIAQQSDGPCYIYDASIIRAQYEVLDNVLNGFAKIYYSVKANPNVEIIRLLNNCGAGAEIASIGEYKAVRAAGVEPNNILFAGPGKRKAELEYVLEHGIGEIHIETLEEIKRLNIIGRPIKASIRVNPIAEAQGGAMRMGGKATAFGFDEEALEEIVPQILASKCIKLVGIHVYGGTQILDAETLVTQWRHSLELAEKLGALIDAPLETVDLGGGLGIPYFQNEKELDMSVVASAIPSLQQYISNSKHLKASKIIVEPGRYLVGPSGIYLSRINAIKTSRGSKFAMIEGGMHHHLAASGNLGQIIKRNYPLVVANKLNEEQVEAVSICGPLCTPLDTLARNQLMPLLEVDDLIAILQSGAYGLTASPNNFLSHQLANEYLIDDDQLIDITN